MALSGHIKLVGAQLTTRAWVPRLLSRRCVFVKETSSGGLHEATNTFARSRGGT